MFLIRHSISSHGQIGPILWPRAPGPGAVSAANA
jgi:hypothetical protein